MKPHYGKTYKKEMFCPSYFVYVLAFVKLYVFCIRQWKSILWAAASMMWSQIVVVPKCYSTAFILYTVKLVQNLKIQK